MKKIWQSIWDRLMRWGYSEVAPILLKYKGYVKYLSPFLLKLCWKTSFHSTLFLELYALASGDFIILLKLSPLKNIFFWLFTYLFLIGESKENLESRDLGEWNMNYEFFVFRGNCFSFPFSLGPIVIMIQMCCCSVHQFLFSWDKSLLRKDISSKPFDFSGGRTSNFLLNWVLRRPLPFFSYPFPRSFSWL